VMRCVIRTAVKSLMASPLLDVDGHIAVDRQ
jgi:hypothetical protein